jgi:hypothetical protein
MAVDKCTVEDETAMVKPKLSSKIFSNFPKLSAKSMDTLGTWGVLGSRYGECRHNVE